MDFDIKAIKEYMSEVPFGNSIFQIENFTAGKETPERRVRHALLQINQKLDALQQAKYGRDRLEIDIDELNEKISNVDTKKYDKRRFEIDLQEKLHCLDNQVKLIEDAEIEILAYKKIIDELPKITRQDFENKELEYWTKRLTNDAFIENKTQGNVALGTAQSLNNIGIMVEKEGNNLKLFTSNKEVQLLLEGK